MGLVGREYFIKRRKKRKYDLMLRDNEHNGMERVVIYRLPEEDAHGLLFGLQIGWMSGLTLKNNKKRNRKNAR